MKADKMMMVESLEDIEDDIENDKELQELSLYQKLAVQGSPTNKSKGRVLKEAKISSMPPILNNMVNQMKPAYEKR